MQIDSGACRGDGTDGGDMLSLERVERIGESVILYDALLVNHMRAAWFDRSSWPEAPAAPGYSGGRGTTLFIRCEGQEWVLRRYHRGGFMARFSTDAFLWGGENRTRSFAEWRLLDRMHRLGLPAPRPVAARYVRRGMLYRADLITQRIPGVEPFSARLGRSRVEQEVWRRIGECIGRFHRAGFFHADLTAHNLQINAADEIFLLDFDRGRRMAGPGSWQRRNLQRLHRSLQKIRGESLAPLSGSNWEAVLAGYRQVVAGAPPGTGDDQTR